jgi:GABA permease
VFLFLLNSSGAVILFVYLLIAISQVVLRRRTAPDKLVVKMWFHPVLSILTIASILAVLGQMYIQEDVRPQLVLSVLVWVVMLVLYFITRWRRGAVGSDRPQKVRRKSSRVLVLANQTMAAVELFDELRSIDSSGHGRYFICVPANSVDSGAAEPEGEVWVEDANAEASVEAARRRLQYTLSTLRAAGLSVEGDIGDFQPMRALEYAVAAFNPDRIVIATYPEERSAWLHHDVVERARLAFPELPLTHVVARLAATSS